MNPVPVWNSKSVWISVYIRFFFDKALCRHRYSSRPPSPVIWYDKPSIIRAPFVLNFFSFRSRWTIFVNRVSTRVRKFTKRRFIHGLEGPSLFVYSFFFKVFASSNKIMSLLLPNSTRPSITDLRVGLVFVSFFLYFSYLHISPAVFMRNVFLFLFGCRGPRWRPRDRVWALHENRSNAHKIDRAQEHARKDYIRPLKYLPSSVIAIRMYPKSFLPCNKKNSLPTRNK